MKCTMTVKELREVLNKYTDDTTVLIALGHPNFDEYYGEFYIGEDLVLSGEDVENDDSFENVSLEEVLEECGFIRNKEMNK